MTASKDPEMPSDTIGASTRAGTASLDRRPSTCIVTSTDTAPKTKSCNNRNSPARSRRLPRQLSVTASRRDDGRRIHLQCVRRIVSCFRWKR